MILVIDMSPSAHLNDGRSAVEILRDLGVKWSWYEGWSDTDSLVFFDCENVPDDLPVFIKKY